MTMAGSDCVDTEGDQSSVRVYCDGVDVADMPRLMDCSACCGLSESQGAIVVDSDYREWTSELVFPVLAVGVSFHHHLVSDGVGVGTSSEILSYVILDNHLLLTLFDEGPVSLELYVQDGVTAEHELSWRSLCRGVDGRVDSTSNCCQDSRESVVLVRSHGRSVR